MNPADPTKATGMARILKVLLLPLFLLIVVLVSYVVTQYRSVPIQVSSETTYLTESLDEDGLPNYVQHVHKQLMKGVTPENNGAVPFWQAAGSQAIPPEKQVWYFAQLGMPVPPPRDPTFDVYDAAAEEIRANGSPSGDAYDIAAGVITRPWRRGELPRLAKWMEDRSEEFGLLDQAATRSRFACPSPEASGECSVVELTWPHLIVMKGMHRNLSARAMLRMGEGDMDGAWRDCQTMFRLANHIESQSLIGWLMKVAAYGQALTTTSALVEVETNAQRVKEIEAFVAKLPPIVDARQIINDFERLMYMSAVVDLSRGRFGIGALTGRTTTVSRAVDWNQILRRGNEAFDALGQALEGDRQQQMENVANWEGEFIVRPEEIGFVGKATRSATLTGRSRTVSDILIATMTPACLSAADAKRNLAIQLHQFRLRARLNAYRCEHGQFPESLTALGADPAMLRDPVNETSYAYERTGNGFFLYSLGANGHDEQGGNKRRKLYRGVEASKAESLLSEPELVQLEKQLAVSRTEWDERHVEALADGDDIAARSPVFAPAPRDVSEAPK